MHLTKVKNELRVLYCLRHYPLSKERARNNSYNFSDEHVPGINVHTPTQILLISGVRSSRASLGSLTHSIIIPHMRTPIAIPPPKTIRGAT
jgi:hypothetical protein